jgi:hypothetical protein
MDAHLSVWAVCRKRNPVVLCSAYGSVDVGQDVVLSDLHRGRCGREVLVVLSDLHRGRSGREVLVVLRVVRRNRRDRGRASRGSWCCE